MPDDKPDKPESSFWSTTTKIATAILAVAAVVGPAIHYVQTRYQDAHPAITGVWSGQPADRRFPPLSVTIFPNPDSSLSGTLSSPCENVTSTPLAAVTLKGVEVSFTVTQLAGSPPITYFGQLEKGAQSQIVGKISQSPVESSFVLTQGDWKGDCGK